MLTTIKASKLFRKYLGIQNFPLNSDIGNLFRSDPELLELSLTPPHTSREKARRAQLILDMNGNTTYIRDPSGASEVRSFAFDHAYWSFDGYSDHGGYLRADPEHKNGNRFSDQVTIWDLVHYFLGPFTLLFSYFYYLI